MQLQENKAYQTAGSLQYYSPEKGYSYFPSSQKPKPSAGLESTRTSRAASPIADTASQTSARQGKESSHQDDDRAIFNSFNLAIRYGSEYMDENPLTGEPGSFKLSTTNRNIRDKHVKETAAEAAKEAAKSEAESLKAASVAPTPVPPPIKTNLERKGSDIGKAKSPISATSGIKKRRKSKAPGTPGIASPKS